MEKLLQRPIRLGVAIALLQEPSSETAGPSARELQRRVAAARDWARQCMQPRYLRLLRAAGADSATLRELQSLAEASNEGGGPPTAQQQQQQQQEPVPAFATPADLEGLMAQHTALKLIVPAIKYFEVCFFLVAR